MLSPPVVRPEAPLCAACRYLREFLRGRDEQGLGVGFLEALPLSTNLIVHLAPRTCRVLGTLVRGDDHHR